MAASIPSEGGGGKRSLDAEINLVPFIDLLCSLISFLLMTAIWMQISSLELKQGSNSDQETALNEPQQTISVQVNGSGFTIALSGAPEINIPCTTEVCSRTTESVGNDGKPKPVVQSYYDFVELEQKLQVEREKIPNQHNVSLVLADGISYNDMIRTMDACLTVGLDGISLQGTTL